MNKIKKEGFMFNLKSGKWVLGGLFGAMYLQHLYFNKFLKVYTFGEDGIYLLFLIIYFVF
jgi:hypothetical protein